MTSAAAEKIAAVKVVRKLVGRKILVDEFIGEAHILCNLFGIFRVGLVKAFCLGVVESCGHRRAGRGHKIEVLSPVVVGWITPNLNLCLTDRAEVGTIHFARLGLVCR